MPTDPTLAAAASANRLRAELRPLSVSADLAAALKVWAQQRIDDPNSEHHATGLRLDSMTCTSTGGQAFRCLGTYSNGMTEQFDVAALPDGHTWVTV